MRFTINQSDSFIHDLISTPKKIVKSLSKTVLKRLRVQPNVNDPPAIKKLTGWKDLWRYRIGDYRIVYHVDPSKHDVVLLMLGHRKDVYDRLGHGASGPVSRIIANPDLKKYLPREPSEEERAVALINSANEDDPPEPTGESDEMLPLALSIELLTSLKIPAKFHSDLGSAKTEGDLLALTDRVQSECIERVMNHMWPPPLERVAETPERILASDEDIESLAEGKVSLESLMLKLDESQKPFVNQFETTLPSGPWMVKGGPGSGKSTVILHCIRGILEQGTHSLDLEGTSVRILFSTYTKSLISAAQHLVRAFEVGDSQHDFEASNVDKLVPRHLPDAWRQVQPKGNHHQAVLRLANQAIQACQKRDKNFSYSSSDVEFLLDEIEWIILGEKISSKAEYSEAPRTGRGRRLGANQKSNLWDFHKEFTDGLRKERICLFTHRLVAAEENATPKYDYVFIDEAQDLKPIAIRFLSKLAKDPKNVFLTADANQTIYGASMAWKKVSAALNFQGRTRILRRNYRTTAENWQAIRPIAKPLDDIDAETLDAETPFHGEVPTLAFKSSDSPEANILESWIRAALLQERVPASCAAILCPTKAHCSKLERSLDSALKPKAFTSGNLDLSHPGVKIMTMHSAKGLQFPIVAVTGLDQGWMPRHASGGMDESESVQKQRRLFFVACSRAMRRLLVCGREDRPSEFLRDLDRDHWEIFEN